ncbi:hypothetical protein [Rhodoferax sp. OV413]|uniref:hypothetical protein n=1 Tax=Rhodoferax sp. OV413 TaxID=1855285 RepID=UPI00115FFFBC|nr:hypothetical protein [Rhodoferax sp. OV413]
MKLKALLYALFAAATTCTSLIFVREVLSIHDAPARENLPWLVLWFFGSLWVAFIAGVPAFAALRRMHLARWWSAAATGATFGAAFAWSLNQDHVSIVSMAGVGAASALAFWFTLAKLAPEAYAA